MTTLACWWWPFSRQEKEPVDEVAARLERAVTVQRKATEELKQLIHEARESERGELPDE